MSGGTANGADKNPCEVVTPEMIEAGADELLGYDRDYESREDAVRRIFTAMWAARRSCLGQPS
jgi:hypothetical protein